MTDAAIPTARPALSIWREKLAGVTPEQATEAALRLIAGAFRRTDKRPRFSIPRRPDDDDALVMDFIKQSARDHHLSRILADEATVEGLARVVFDGFPPTEHGYTTEMQEQWYEAKLLARAVLNHLAQLALGESQ